MPKDWDPKKIVSIVECKNSRKYDYWRNSNEKLSHSIPLGVIFLKCKIRGMD